MTKSGYYFAGLIVCGKIMLEILAFFNIVFIYIKREMLSNESNGRRFKI